MKYTIVPSLVSLDDANEYDTFNQVLNWIEYPEFGYTDMQSDLEFIPTFEDKSLPVLVPKESLPKVSPIKLPKKEIKDSSTIKMQFKNRREFVDFFTNGYLRLGVKNPDIAKAMAVQDLLESLTKDGQGFSKLATEYNNYGGIKYTGKDPNKGVGMVTDEYINGKKETLDENDPGAQFRKFNSPQEYMSYKLNMMRNGNFRGALDGDINHYLSVLMGNNPGGKKYATAPHYADYLRSMISKYNTGGPISKSKWWEITPYMYSGDDILYSPKRKYDINQTTDEGDRYYDIVNNRIKDAEDALIRNGFGFNSNFLKHLLAVQSILETGWVDNVSNNNYGGHRYGGNKASFDSKESFWDNHIRNLNNKWGKDNVNGAWYSSTGIHDYINRINNPDLNTTKIEYDKYNLKRRKDKLPEQYLYAPIWDNEGENYLDQINSILDRYFYYYNNRQK